MKGLLERAAAAEVLKIPVPSGLAAEAVASGDAGGDESRSPRSSLVPNASDDSALCAELAGRVCTGEPKGTDPPLAPLAAARLSASMASDASFSAALFDSPLSVAAGECSSPVSGWEAMPFAKGMVTLPDGISMGDGRGEAANTLVGTGLIVGESGAAAFVSGAEEG